MVGIKNSLRDGAYKAMPGPDFIAFCVISVQILKLDPQGSSVKVNLKLKPPCAQMETSDCNVFEEVGCAISKAS